MGSFCINYSLLRALGTWTSKMPKILAHDAKTESMGSVGFIILGLFWRSSCIFSNFLESPVPVAECSDSRGGTRWTTATCQARHYTTHSEDFGSHPRVEIPGPSKYPNWLMQLGKDAKQHKVLKRMHRYPKRMGL